jgi:sugar phosphate isomerase/epimerase
MPRIETIVPPTPIRFIFFADLHLSDRLDTAAHCALEWAVETINRERPDFLAVAGDATTFGTQASTAHLLAALNRIERPVYFTPGNAELRDRAGLTLYGERLTPASRHLRQGDLSVLFPDTSTGTLPATEREWLQNTCLADSAKRHILITHFPLDALQNESAEWLAQWLTAWRVELVVSGHRHIHRRRALAETVELVCRGMDPDKAIGDMPGLSLIESTQPNEWCERFLPWSPAIELLPTDLPKGIHPVGWSIHGDPVEATRETREFGLSCLEIRPKEMDFSRPALHEELAQLRDMGPLYLSYHLPNLAWNETADGFTGEEDVVEGLELALAVGAASLTVHVPRARAELMEKEEEPTELYSTFQDLYAQLFGDAVRSGVRLSIENIHNPASTPIDSPALEFATRIDEYLRWIDAVQSAIADTPANTIGAHFDIGHARNNGGDLDNMQPLGDWYARIGTRITGYHIHQVNQNPQTGKLANHLTIENLFGPRISYAGFLWAWSKRQINRAPLFVEVRQAAGRRETAARLKNLFDNADRIREAADLPDREPP